MTTATEGIFSPIRVGTMSLGHRLVVPPHSGGGGALLGTEEQFDRMCRYWLARVEGGMQWVGGGPVFVRNPLIPGFEPSGIGANADGFFRHPAFTDRLGRYMDRLHAAGGFGTVQMVLQGGMPIAPSQTLSGHLDHAIPHRLDLDEIAWLIAEYGNRQSSPRKAGADAIELHSNHDDVLQWFLSPRTNQRDDQYGGDFAGRRRMVKDVCAAIRGHVTRPVTLGLRLCLDERIDGGYGVGECAAFVEAFTADGTVDYFSLDIGSNWGSPSYVPIGTHPEGEWAVLAGQVKAATHLPVVYAGRVVHPRVAEAILAAGHADLVGMARALIADPRLVSKTRAGRRADIRPCIAVNDCINRRSGENLPFACSVNPDAGREFEGPTAKARYGPRRAGGRGGPGRDRGRRPRRRARAPGNAARTRDRIGGQLAVAALARMNHQYADWIQWQQRRLRQLGVTVELNHQASADDVLTRDPGVIVVATGARPRVPEIPGVDLPHVVTSVGRADRPAYRPATGWSWCPKTTARHRWPWPITWPAPGTR